DALPRADQPDRPLAARAADVDADEGEALLRVAAFLVVGPRLLDRAELQAVLLPLLGLLVLDGERSALLPGPGRGDLLPVFVEPERRREDVDARALLVALGRGEVVVDDE